MTKKQFLFWQIIYQIRITINSNDFMSGWTPFWFMCLSTDFWFYMNSNHIPFTYIRIFTISFRIIL